MQKIVQSIYDILNSRCYNSQCFSTVLVVLNKEERVKKRSLIEANRIIRKAKREGNNVPREEGTARLSEPVRISPPQAGPLTSSMTSGPFSFPSQDGPSPAGPIEGPSTSQQISAHPEASNSILESIFRTQDEHHSRLPTGSMGRISNGDSAFYVPSSGGGVRSLYAPTR